MLQSNTIPDEAYVLLLQKHSFILDILADLPGTIQIKNKITEVFTYYILFSGEGSEESKDYKDKLLCLLMGLHEIIDAIAVQKLNDQQS